MPKKYRTYLIFGAPGSGKGTQGRTLGTHQFKPDFDFLVLDGIPRNLAQADLMDPFIDVRRVFHLSCPDRDRIVTRLKKRAVKDNRLDDANEEVIHQRLDTYHQESKAPARPLW